MASIVLVLGLFILFGFATCDDELKNPEITVEDFKFLEREVSDLLKLILLSVKNIGRGYYPDGNAISSEQQQRLMLGTKQLLDGVVKNYRIFRALLVDYVQEKPLNAKDAYAQQNQPNLEELSTNDSDALKDSSNIASDFSEITKNLESEPEDSKSSNISPAKYEVYKYISDFIDADALDNSDKSGLQDLQEEFEVVLLDRSGPLAEPSTLPDKPEIDYSNHDDIPVTSFTCNDKIYKPGFYADVETGCKVFHVCFSHRMESFLCPTGTLFNQQFLACDYWDKTNCSASEEYFHLNDGVVENFSPEQLIATDPPTDEKTVEKIDSSLYTLLLSMMPMKFIPQLIKITDYPDSPKSKEFKSSKESVELDHPDSHKIKLLELFSSKRKDVPEDELEAENIRKKKYEELFGGLRKKNEQTEYIVEHQEVPSSTMEPLIQKFEQSKRKFKLDRSGEMEDSAVDEDSTATSAETSTEEIFSSIIPEIVQEMLDSSIESESDEVTSSDDIRSAGSIFKKGISPSKKDIALLNYLSSRNRL